MHTGIHAGLVLFDEGDLVRGRFEMLGNATNIAAHLGDVAQSDEILVSEETLGPETYFFRTSERRYVALKVARTLSQLFGSWREHLSARVSRQACVAA